MPDWAIPVIIVTVVISFQFTIVLLAVLSKGSPDVMTKLIAIEQALAEIVSGNIIKPKQ